MTPASVDSRSGIGVETPSITFWLLASGGEDSPPGSFVQNIVEMAIY